jgi:catechol 2,3-dioxygenase-like lactoylglutathione lyase family enzyme
MPATSFNHVSIRARSLSESGRFYTDLFGMERIPSPVFRYPTAWLRLGDHQLHLIERDDRVPRSQHFALNVDDVEAVYVKAMALGIEDRETWGWHLHVDWPDVDTLDTSVVTDLRKLADEVTHDEDAARATLFLAR